MKRIFLGDHKVSDWLGHYPPRIRETTATYDKQVWTIDVWAGAAGEVATGKVDDTSGAVTEAWTGPQVAWKMARGYPGAFGGKQINSAGVWLGFCLLFLRRPRRPAPPADPAQPRPARAALVQWLALVLQPRRHLHQRAARLPADALPARANGLERLARAPRDRLGPGLADLGARRPPRCSRPASASA